MRPKIAPGRVRGGAIVLVVMAGILLVALLVPPAPIALAPVIGGVDAGVRGTVHVHTRRSDGSGTVEEVAAAAAEAGLDFVVLTDHGEATRMPARPARYDGVLVIDGVEISTWDGHVVALGLPQAPYPLAGEGRDVVEDVARLGGFAIAAHPDSPREELRWRDWDVPVDGLEWLNGDSAWRDEGPLVLLRTLLTYPFRPAATLAALADRPEGLLERWDALTLERRVVALAGSDAHARLGVRRDHAGGGVALHVPGYAAAFRAMSIVLPGLGLSGDAGADAAAVIDAIRGGRLYSVIDGLATPGVLHVAATSGVHAAGGGDILPLDGPVAVDVRSNAPPDARLVLYRDGQPVAEATGDRLTYDGPEARAVYRVEVHLAGARGAPPVPWILSNPIYVGWQQEAPGDARPPANARPAATPLAVEAPAWEVEASANARGVIDRVPGAPETFHLFRYALGGTRDESPFVAFVTREVEALRTAAGVSFTIWADRPMRVSIQVRQAAGDRLDRWHRSVYADDTARPVVVRFDDMRPRGEVSEPRPVAAEIESLLVVIDTVNTALGSGGRVRIESLSALPPE